MMTVIEHFWALTCQECETKKTFTEYDVMLCALSQHRRETGHRVVSGMAKRYVDRPSGITHAQAIANVANIGGIASIVSDTRS